jgi:hypothetical protein
MFMGLIAAAIARREPEFAASALGKRWVRTASTANGSGAAVGA